MKSKMVSPIRRRLGVFVSAMLIAALPALSLPGLGADPFADVPADHTFSADISWLAAAGITRGCNPPVNDRFCPDDAVTRGQMAAFLGRALGLTDRGDTDFVDDDESVFEADIERLAAAGITRGCNPPVNDRFCPDDAVTRGQMAAFLGRALGLTDRGDTDFVDDDESVFEADIERLAAAGITRGCNPPVNDRFCPDDPVTRAQMAAFLRRALEGGSVPTTTTTSTTTTTTVPAALHITTTELPDLHIFEEYTAAISAAGGTPPYTWEILTGVDELVGDADTGEIRNDSPASPITDTTDLVVDVTVTDSVGDTDSTSLPLTILDVVDVSAGTEHSCAVDESGAAFCWGLNTAGQLGDGTTDTSNLPVRVDMSGVVGIFTSISAGSNHTCAVTTHATGPKAYCWGNNTFGQLGDDSFEPSPVPTPVHTSFAFGLVGSVSAGQRHTCARDTVDRVWCWGANSRGQLGNGSTGPSNIPVMTEIDVMGTTSEVHAGRDHTCAVGTDDRAYCWGAPELVGGHAVPGEDQLEPTWVFDASMGDVTHLSVGAEHTCAIDVGGDAWCWGSDDRGQFGDGSSVTVTAFPVATDSFGTSNASQISSGMFHTCAVNNGVLYCWGEDALGRLGDGQVSDGTSPAASVSGAVQVAGGGAHTCLLTSNGGVWCTGYNENGQLGTGNYTNRALFTAVRPGPS